MQCIPKHLHIYAIFTLIIILNNVYAETIGEDEDHCVEVRLPWALGVVFPDGTLLENGLRLDWSKVSNITVVYVEV